ncbi:hypothetical protein LEL_04392 [Akanthomyces lecanii RCEF 1005]|uniref:Uncharacterized protein n=1 Tax=Akanthomyces lecanii RCEF 1005 TaxID=1081108 RepID=A0A168HBW0_CORDF|nr:hypothetical protein LEL_04392 [Akanthomyces lecanii RCEF 1005]
MDRLPQEVIDRIAALLPDVKLVMTAQPPTPSPYIPRKSPSMMEKLVSKVRRESADPKRHKQGNAPSEPKPTYWTRASAAAVSHKWQRAIEPVVYSRLHLGYLGLEKLKSALERRPERRAYLRSLTVVLALTTDHHHWTELGVKDDFLAPLFSVLGSDTQRAAVDLTLRFEAGHPDLRHRARHGIVLDRNRSNPLGVAVCVRRLDFTLPVPKAERDRRNVLQLHLTDQARLIAHFPNLQSVAWHCAESESQAERDAAREGFANHIAAHLPLRRQIKQVSLTLSVGPLGARICAPSSVGADSYENLYAKLRVATAHVTDLRYAGVVGPSFFQDSDGGGGMQWRALRSLTIGMAMLTPTGQFYFDRDVGINAGGELDTPLDWRHAESVPLPPQHALWFRTEPNAATMTPLLRAFAELLERLPALQGAQLLARREPLPGTRLPWAVCYFAPGRTSNDWVGGSELDIERPRIWFVTGRCWPADDLVQEFRSAGRRAGHGQDASVIHWSTLEGPVRIGL